MAVAQNFRWVCWRLTASIAEHWAAKGDAINKPAKGINASADVDIITLPIAQLFGGGGGGRRGRRGRRDCGNRGSGGRGCGSRGGCYAAEAAHGYTRLAKEGSHARSNFALVWSVPVTAERRICDAVANVGRSGCSCDRRMNTAVTCCGTKFAHKRACFGFANPICANLFARFWIWFVVAEIAARTSSRWALSVVICGHANLGIWFLAWVLSVAEWREACVAKVGFRRDWR